MEKAFDVVGIGHPCVDYALRVDRMPQADTGCGVLGATWQGGGVVPTGLVAAARLGLRCALIGRVGDDLMGRFCHQDLSDYGIDLSQVKVVPGGMTDMAVILSDDETHGRSIIYRRGTVEPMKWEDISPEFLSSARYLHIAGSDPVSVQAARVVKAAGGGVLLDAGYGKIESYAPVLPYVDCFIGAAHVYRNSFGNSGYEPSLREVRRMGPGIVAFTFGSLGVRALGPCGYIEVPAFQVEVVDTLGAGDVFHGAFFYGLKHGFSLEKTIRFASAASAIKCTAPGGRAGIPTAGMVERFLETGEIDRDEMHARIDRYAWGLDNYLRGE